MRIKVFDRKRAVEQSRVDFAEDKIIISISTPGEEFPEFYEQNYSILDILFLSFYDIEDENEIRSVATDGQIFNDDMAAQIAEFVRFWSKKNDNVNIWVHCDAGVSRSAGVAAALQKYFYGDDSMYFSNDGKYFPNMLCYTKTLEKLHEIVAVENN